LSAIADAIREKDGTSEPIKAKDFPERIRAISAGSPPGSCGIGVLEYADPDKSVYSACVRLAGINGTDCKTSFEILEGYN